jgi:protein O-mannosyl-transferase
LDYWPLNRFSEANMPGENFLASNPQSSTLKLKWPVFIEKWPFFLLASAMCAVTCLSQHDALNTLENVPFGLRLENALTAYGGYLYKMVWPVNLTIFYPLHAHIAWQLLAESAIVLVGVSIISLLEWKRSPWLIVGWLWFLGTLMPVIGLVQVGSQAMADRYSYFPLV